jgi:hypothetical protein
MKAIFLNKYFDGTYTYYDLTFEENEECIIRLNGVTFPNEPLQEDLEAAAYSFAETNLTDHVLDQIIIN